MDWLAKYWWILVIVFLVGVLLNVSITVYVAMRKLSRSGMAKCFLLIH